MNTAQRWIGIGVLVVVAIAVAWFVWPRRGNAPDDAGAVPPVPVAVVRPGTVEQTIALSGRVGSPAGTQAKLAFAVAGTVARVDVRLGDRVEAGTPLAELDATGYSLAAQQAGADAQAAAASAAASSVDRTSVKLRVDRAELLRQQRLYAAGVVALRDVQAAQAALAADAADAQSARAQIDAARAQARSASAHAGAAGYDLARTVLRAPNAGVVSAIYVQSGEGVDVTTPAIGLTSSVASLATLDVPVDQVARVAAGDRVRAQAGTRSFDAHVAGVAPAVDPATGLAMIDITGVPSDLATGTPVSATVVTGLSQGLVVPRSAIVQDPQTGAMLAFVQARDKDGTMKFTSRPVRISDPGTGSDSVLVVSGLRAGDRVAATGAIDLLAPAGGGGD